MRRTLEFLILVEEDKTRDQGLKRHRAVPDNQQLNFLSKMSSSNLMRNDAVLVWKQNARKRIEKDIIIIIIIIIIVILMLYC